MFEELKLLGRNMLTRNVDLGPREERKCQYFFVCVMQCKGKESQSNPGVILVFLFLDLELTGADNIL